MEIQFFVPLEEALPQSVDINPANTQDLWLLIALLAATIIAIVTFLITTRELPKLRYSISRKDAKGQRRPDSNEGAFA